MNGLWLVRNNVFALWRLGGDAVWRDGKLIDDMLCNSRGITAGRYAINIKLSNIKSTSCFT